MISALPPFHYSLCFSESCRDFLSNPLPFCLTSTPLFPHLSAFKHCLSKAVTAFLSFMVSVLVLCFSVTVLNTVTKSNLGGGGRIYLVSHATTGHQGKAGQELKAGVCSRNQQRNSAYWPAPWVKLNLPIYTVQAHLLRDGGTHSGLSFPSLIIHQENSQQIQAVLWLSPKCVRLTRKLIRTIVLSTEKILFLSTSHVCLSYLLSVMPQV